MGEDGIGGRVVPRGRQWKREELPSFRPDPACRPRTRQEPGRHQTPQVTASHNDFAASLERAPAGLPVDGGRRVGTPPASVRAWSLLYSACGIARSYAISKAAVMSRLVRGSELKV
jgi:hypothetical protein